MLIRNFKWLLEILVFLLKMSYVEIIKDNRYPPEFQRLPYTFQVPEVNIICDVKCSWIIILEQEKHIQGIAMYQKLNLITFDFSQNRWYGTGVNWSLNLLSGVFRYHRTLFRRYSQWFGIKIIGTTKPSWFSKILPDFNCIFLVVSFRN